MVIFGASGDLTKRKLLPSLYNLAAANLLPRQFAIIGYAYQNGTNESFREQLTQDMKNLATNTADPHVWDWLLERIHYVQGDFQDPAGYQRLATKLAEVEKDHGTLGNRFYYLATAPKFFADVVRQLGSSGLAKEENGKYSRVVIEMRAGANCGRAGVRFRQSGCGPSSPRCLQSRAHPGESLRACA